MASTLPVSVTPEEQARLLAKAEARGVTVDALVRQALLPIIDSSEPTAIPGQLCGEDLEKAFEEIADIIPESVPPLSAESLRREKLYSREDEP